MFPVLNSMVCVNFTNLKKIIFGMSSGFAHKLSHTNILKQTQTYFIPNQQTRTEQKIMENCLTKEIAKRQYQWYYSVPYCTTAYGCPGNDVGSLARLVIRGSAAQPLFVGPLSSPLSGFNSNGRLGQATAQG